MSFFKSIIASGLLGAAALLGAGAAQAQVSIGAPIAPGIYGRVDIGNGYYPQLYADTPFIVNDYYRNRAPVYMYVPDNHRRAWRNYCDRYDACDRPVYFVREGRRHYKYEDRDERQWRHRGYYRNGNYYYWDGRNWGERRRKDNGRHLGWERGRGNPHRGDNND